MNKTYIILSILVIFLFSCQKEIEYKGDKTDGFLVVNGIIENDSLILVSLSKSTPAIGEQNTGLTEINSLATLSLTDNTTNEIFTSNLVNSLGYYEFATTAKAGHSYSISISHPDFPNATSSMSSPQNISISSWDSTSTEEPGYNSGEVLKLKNVHINWQDPDGTNTYAVKVLSIDTITGIENSLYPKVNIETDNEGSQSQQLITFNDLTFNNTSKSLTISFYEDYYFDPFTGLPSGEKSYRILLYNLSSEVYNYIVSTNKAINSGNSPFSEPVKVYTNIMNGLGIFGGISNSCVKIK